jgi:hypothetical protein
MNHALLQRGSTGSDGEYADAAILVRTHKRPGKVSSVAYHLAGHSIELALKSFLRARGSSLKSLRSIGHSLTKLVDEAEARGLARVVDISDDGGNR